DLREVIGRDLPQSVIDQIIAESDMIGDHKIWKEEFLALREESAIISMDREQSHPRIDLKRSNSADDFDLVKTRSLDDRFCDRDVIGTDLFQKEKAKSVRKASQIA
ncbi:hypothetical protein ACHAWF_008738, partial [Thalassiosira exigua]